MKWLENLSNAISYIEDNLEKDISYDEIAHVACCSTYYFQRIFSYVTGSSLSEYIRRRRMTQAAFELQRTNQKVIDIAFKYGYSSPTSFNRAFQNVHGIAPFEAKKIGSKLNAYPAIKFSVKVIGGDAMTYHIEKKEAIRIIGIKSYPQKIFREYVNSPIKNLREYWELVYIKIRKIFFTILQLQQIGKFRQVCLNMKYRQVHGLFLKMMVI